MAAIRISLRSIFPSGIKAFHSTGCSRVQISVQYSSAAQLALRGILDLQLSGIHQAGTWKDERVITTKQAPEIAVHGQTEKLLNFCANNYLGLSSHPEVIQAAKDALDKYGNGLSSVRFICGTQVNKRLTYGYSIYNGNKTEWSPVWSVIIQVTYKIR